MELARRLLERAAPRSTFSLVLLTLSVICLIVGLFAQDLRPVSVEGEFGDLEDEAEYANLDQTRTPAQASVAGGIGKRLGKLDGGFRLPEPTEDFSAVSGLSEDRDSDNSSSFSSHDIDSLASTEGLTDKDLLGYSGERNAMAAAVEPSKQIGKLASASIAPGCIATLSRTSDCRWGQNANDIHEGSQLKIGQTLNIAAGLVEIVFGCGATAVVEGPAVIELESSKAGSLHTGKLTANVPDDIDFTVHTPTAQIVSLQKNGLRAVAKISSVADCLWAEGCDAMKEGAALLPGQAVKLAGGLAEITFDSGAKVILQGPANLEIESNKTATLKNGRLTADVPDTLDGFKIHTSTAEILSLPAEPKSVASADPKVATKHPTQK